MSYIGVRFSSVGRVLTSCTEAMSPRHGNMSSSPAFHLLHVTSHLSPLLSCYVFSCAIQIKPKKYSKKKKRPISRPPTVTLYKSGQQNQLNTYICSRCTEQVHSACYLATWQPLYTERGSVKHGTVCYQTVYLKCLKVSMMG